MNTIKQALNVDRPSAWKGPNQFEHRPDGTTVLFLKYKGETKECIIWTRDYEKVEGYYWRVDRRASRRIWSYYAVAYDRVQKNKICVHMHRILVPDGEQADHKNHNGLDNRVYDPLLDIGNIRSSTPSQNNGNRRSYAHSSIFKGVCWNKRDQKWEASIKVNYKSIHLGMFDTELEASFAYQEAAKKHFGDFACWKTAVRITEKRNGAEQ